MATLSVKDAKRVLYSMGWHNVKEGYIFLDNDRKITFSPERNPKKACMKVTEEQLLKGVIEKSK